LLALHVGGCGRLALYAGNTVTTGEQDTFLVAMVERGHGRLAHRLANVEVCFYAGGKELACTRTDEVGYAVATGRVPPGARMFEARASIQGHALQAQAEVLNRPPGRTILVCDVDGTISQTDFHALVSSVLNEKDIKSRAVPDAAETLQHLARQYNIVYLTDRPVYLHYQSDKWLSDHGFPSAPVICAPDLRISRNVLQYKRTILATLKKLYPDALIGFGNEETDAEAYAAEGMLAIMIDDGKHRHFRSDALFLRTWSRVRQFFDANDDALRDPVRLRTLMSEGRLQFKPGPIHNRTAIPRCALI
jgi:phosphatidate phosphatase APP1